MPDNHDMETTNEAMKAGRYLRWANARKVVADIKSHLADGGVVAVCTALKATYYTSPKQAELFEARKDGAYVRVGKRMDCISYCAIKFGRKAA